MFSINTSVTVFSSYGEQQLALAQEQKELLAYKKSLLKLNRDAADYFCKQLLNGKNPGYNYLSKNRHLSEQTIKNFCMGYAEPSLYEHLQKLGYSIKQMQDTGLVKVTERGVKTSFWKRVMFPIADANNNIIGFGGRVMGNAKPKYLNSKDSLIFEKRKNLYGINIAKNSDRQGIILCEGYMDVISLHQRGIKNVVAPLRNSINSTTRIFT